MIEAAGSLAMPGLVNAHFHSSGTFNRGLVDNLPLELFMLYELPPFDFGPFPAELYRARVLLGAIEMLKTGVTAVFDDPIFSPEPSGDADRCGHGRLPRLRDPGDRGHLPAEHARSTRGSRTSASSCPRTSSTGWSASPCPTPTP